MTTHRLMRFYCLIALLALVSTSCGKSQRAPQPTQTNIEIKPALGSATLEPTLTPTRTAPPTLPPLPSPTPNLLTLADLPVHLGTSLPQDAKPLSPDNAGALRLLGLWGLGSPLLSNQLGMRLDTLGRELPCSHIARCVSAA